MNNNNYITIAIIIDFNEKFSFARFHIGLTSIQQANRNLIFETLTNTTILQLYKIYDLFEHNENIMQ